MNQLANSHGKKVHHIVKKFFYKIFDGVQIKRNEAHPCNLQFTSWAYCAGQLPQLLSNWQFGSTKLLMKRAQIISHTNVREVCSSIVPREVGMTLSWWRVMKTQVVIVLIGSFHSGLGQLLFSSKFKWNTHFRALPPQICDMILLHSLLSRTSRWRPLHCFCRLAINCVWIRWNRTPGERHKLSAAK